MDDTPHHLSHKTSATPPPLARVADIVDRLRAAAHSGDLALGQSFDCIAVADEIERLRASIIEMRQLLDEFWVTCTEEHNSVEMFALHRAAGHAIARAYDAVPEEADRG